MKQSNQKNWGHSASRFTMLRWLASRGRVSVLCGVGLLALVSIGMTARGQSVNDNAAGDPAGAAVEKPAAQQALENLRNQRKPNRPIEPTTQPGVGLERPRPSMKPGVADAAVLGVAPGLEKPQLRREGEFVRGRRGRLVRATGSNQMLFQFEADGEQSPEAPMVMLPCRMLQSMEDIVVERGDQIVFTVTGQVFVYRGSNYLLPTVVTQAVNKANLQM